MEYGGYHRRLPPSQSLEKHQKDMHIAVAKRKHLLVYAKYQQAIAMVRMWETMLRQCAIQKLKS
jgi:hypothetical protein